MRREIEFMSRLNHPHVVKILEGKNSSIEKNVLCLYPILFEDLLIITIELLQAIFFIKVLKFISDHNGKYVFLSEINFALIKIHK